jgi:hypothetical protein
MAISGIRKNGFDKKTFKVFKTLKASLGICAGLLHMSDVTESMQHCRPYDPSQTATTC